MSNFDFLKNFNRQLYEIGQKLEKNVITSPKEVQNDTMLFLKVLVEHIFELSNKKVEDNMLAFYKQTDYLTRSGKISYGFKNKLLDAFNSANKIHKINNNLAKQKELALSLDKKLFYIAKKYYTDYCPSYKQITIPPYSIPEKTAVYFKNCIICGCENISMDSNMCMKCNRKIENGSYLLNFKNTFKDKFTKNDLYDFGLNESQINLLLMDFTKEGIVKNKGSEYVFNKTKVNSYLELIDDFVEMGLLLDKFYSNRISPVDIKKSSCYIKAKEGNEYYQEFYRLVFIKLIENFEKNTLIFDDVETCMRQSALTYNEIKEWYNNKMISYLEGQFNESFIQYNKLLIKKYLTLKREGRLHNNILSQLEISEEIYEFWLYYFDDEEFKKKNDKTTKDLIIKQIKNNKNLKETLKILNINQDEFERLYDESEANDDEFYYSFNNNYNKKRQKLFLKNLKNNNLKRAIRKSKITNDDFWQWYMDGEKSCSDFYIRSTKIFMDKYLKYRKSGFNKKDILKYIQIDKNTYNLWEKDTRHELFNDFKKANQKITLTLIKRGKIINALKEDMTKSDALEYAGITVEEFDEIYELSKKEKSEFYIRFDSEYLKNRKRALIKHLKSSSFKDALDMSDLTQEEFRNFYIKDQSKFIANQKTENYSELTQILMEKYLTERSNGNSKEISAKAIGLTNIIISKWVKHTEFELYADFKSKLIELHLELICNGLKNECTILEISKNNDINFKTINKYIELGKNRVEEYIEVYELYEHDFIPRHLKKFLDYIERKKFDKALNDSKITLEELNYYYDLGKKEGNEFRVFYEKYLKTKKLLYASNILDKKSPRIALKNSHMTHEEFENGKDEIDDLILTGRINMCLDGLYNGNTNGEKLSKIAGVSVDEIYDWYFKGKEGDEKFEQFAIFFELRVITSRLMAIENSMTLGMSKNMLVNKLKKNIGAEDYRIWNERGILDKDVYDIFDLDNDIVDYSVLQKYLNESDFIKSCHETDDPQTFQFLKKAFKGNSTFSKSNIPLSSADKIEVTKKQILGK